MLDPKWKEINFDMLHVRPFTRLASLGAEKRRCTTTSKERWTKMSGICGIFSPSEPGLTRNITIIVPTLRKV